MVNSLVSPETDLSRFFKAEPKGPLVLAEELGQIIITCGNEYLHPSNYHYVDEQYKKYMTLAKRHNLDSTRITAAYYRARGNFE
jgi:hypothetical protein